MQLEHVRYYLVNIVVVALGGPVEQPTRYNTATILRPHYNTATIPGLGPPSPAEDFRYENRSGFG